VWWEGLFGSIVCRVELVLKDSGNKQGGNIYIYFLKHRSDRCVHEEIPHFVLRKQNFLMNSHSTPFPTVGLLISQ
jgi:hypothetical protein